jgi:hypothetical protein
VEKEKEKEVDRGMRFVHLGGQEESSAVLPCEPSIKGTPLFHPHFFPRRSTISHFLFPACACFPIAAHSWFLSAKPRNERNYRPELENGTFEAGLREKLAFDIFLPIGYPQDMPLRNCSPSKPI